MPQTVKVEVLNPKCITMGELYGEFNPLTQEWHDGLASTIMRRAVAEEGDHKRYLPHREELSTHASECAAS